MKNRYFVRDYNWEGHGDVDEEIKNGYGKFFDTKEEAINEYNRLWEEELDSEEGAYVYDIKEKIMIIED